MIEGKDGLAIWVIYDHPKDYPHCFVARKFIYDKPTPEMMVSPNLIGLQTYFSHIGLVSIARSPSDDPVIVESWL